MGRTELVEIEAANSCISWRTLWPTALRKASKSVLELVLGAAELAEDVVVELVLDAVEWVTVVLLLLLVVAEGLKRGDLHGLLVLGIVGE